MRLWLQAGFQPRGQESVPGLGVVTNRPDPPGPGEWHGLGDG